MTPNNIINMASLKGLDIIAITDHNSLKQLPIIHEICLSYNLVLVYGVEVATKEDIHVLVYFLTLEDAMSFDQFLETVTVHEAYDTQKYGEQILTDIEDFTTAVIPYYLGRPIELDLIQLVDILKNYQHLRFFAHIDRDKNSGLKYYQQIDMNGVECTKRVSKEFIKEHLSKTSKIIYNSDAHQLTDISERDPKNMFELEEKSIEAFFKAFQNG